MIHITAMTCLCVDVFDGTQEVRPGGEALNFAAASCSYEGVNMSLIGGIGDDSYGKDILNAVKELPINISCVHVLQGGITANNRTYLTAEGDRYYKDDSWQAGVYESFGLSDQDRAKMEKSQVVHTNYSCPLFSEILALKKKYGFKLSVDFDKERNFQRFEEVLPWIDFFFISGEEAILPVMKEWSLNYPGIFTATLAEKGSVSYWNGVEYRAEAVKVDQVIDTTGCGDSYQAGFVCSVMKDGDINKAMEEGSKRASVTLSHIGGF